MALRLRRRRTPARPDLEERFGDYTSFVGPHSPFANYQPSSIGSVYQDQPEQALTGTIAIYACVSLLADVVGSLPLHLFLKGEDGRDRVDAKTAIQSLRGVGYPGTLARVIGELPNPEMTSQELWSIVVGHCGLWGNAYVEIVRDSSGRPMELWPLRPDRMEVRRGSGTVDQGDVGQGPLTYRYTLEQNDRTMRRKVVDLPADRVMHVKAFGTDGVMGVSPITVARRMVASDQAMEAFIARWYENSAMPSSILTIPPAPGDASKSPTERFKERAKMYRDEFQQLHGGVSNAGRVAVMEQGINWQAVSMPMTDMAFVESKRMHVVEAARLYKIPNHLVGETTRDTSWGSGIEQLFMGWLAVGLRPILQRLENACNRSLGLVSGVRTLLDESLYPEFVVSEMLRTDIKTRYEAYAVGKQWGFLTDDDIRPWENLPKLPNGSKPWMPLNFQLEGTPASAALPTPAPPATLPAAASADMEIEDRRTDAIMELARTMRRSTSRVEVNTPPIDVTFPEAMRLEAPPQENHIQVDLSPLTTVLGGMVSAIDRLEKSQEAMREAIRPIPMAKQVIRDEHSNIVYVKDVPVDEVPTEAPKEIAKRGRKKA